MSGRVSRVTLAPMLKGLTAVVLTALLAAEPCAAADAFRPAAAQRASEPVGAVLPAAGMPGLPATAVPLKISAPSVLAEAGAPSAQVETDDIDVVSAPLPTALPIEMSPPERAQAAVSKILKDPFERREFPQRSIEPSAQASAPTLSPADPVSATQFPIPLAERKIYLLSKPLNSTASLGWLAQCLHYGLETLFQAAKAAVLFYLTGNVWAAVMLFAWEIPPLPFAIAGQSRLDLELRSMWRRAKELRPLAHIPGVERIKVLRIPHTTYRGLVAVKYLSEGFVFLESSQPPLLEALPPGLGAALLIKEPRRAKLRFELILRGARSPVRWSPRLSRALSNAPGAAISSVILKKWREQYRAYLRNLPVLKRHGALHGVNLEVSLIEGEGPTMLLGTISEGASVNDLLGLTWSARAWRWARIRFFRGSRGVSLGDTEIARADPAAPWTVQIRNFGRKLLGRLSEY